MQDPEDRLWHEVRALMDEAGEEEQQLSSDDEGYVERLMEGNSAPSSIHSLRVQEGQPTTRGSAAVAVGGLEFSSRLNAAFHGLDRHTLSGSLGAVDLSRQVGPVFSRQCEGFGLSEALRARQRDGHSGEEAVPRVGSSRHWVGAPEVVDAAADGGAPSGSGAGGNCGDAAGAEEEEEEEEEEDGWGSGAEVDDDWGSGAEDEGKDGGIDDSAEWSSRTASWATKCGGSDESDDDEEDAMQQDFDVRQVSPGVPTPTGHQPPVGAFGGVADLDDLADDPDGDEDQPGERSNGLPPKRSAVADQLVGDLDGGAVGGPSSASAHGGKRVRFEERGAAVSSASSRPLKDLDTGDPHLAGYLGEQASPS